MKGLDQIDQWIHAMEGAADEMESPQVFFTAHEERYLEIARRVAVQTLSAMMPQGMDPATWRENIMEFADMILTRPLQPGLAIIFANRTEMDRIASRNRAGDPANFTPITWDDVLEWVRAGPENGGKDKTAIENTRDRSDEQIAYDVHHAIRQHRLGIEKKDFSRIIERLEDWVNTRLLSGDMDAMLTAMLDAWVGVLRPLMERDFRDWIVANVIGHYR